MKRETFTYLVLPFYGWNPAWTDEQKDFAQRLWVRMRALQLCRDDPATVEPEAEIEFDLMMAGV